MEYFQGYLIAKERLKKNWSQEGLCKGICAISYLSKIETGKTVASKEIITLLMGRLGLKYDLAIEKEAQALVEEAFDLLFAFRSDELDSFLDKIDFDFYRATNASINLEILNAINTTHQPLNWEFEVFMDARALAIQRVLQKREEEAVKLYPNAFIYLMQGLLDYEKAHYSKAIDILQTAYDLAAKEGKVRIMLQCKVLIGNCYSNQQEISNMQQCYNIARQIAKDINDSHMIRTIDYNIASSWIEVGRFEDSYNWFSKLENPSVLELHKLAICCEKTQRFEEGLLAIEKAQKLDLTVPNEVDPTSMKQLLDLVKFRLEHLDYLQHQEYGELLLECYELCQTKLSSGFAGFHLPWLLEWYKATRQYKKVCDLFEKLNFPKNII